MLLLDAVKEGTTTLADYSYLGRRRVHEREYGVANVTSTWEFDARGRVDRTRHHDGGGYVDDREYAWDAVNNKVMRERQTAGLYTGAVIDYDYDGLNRLVQSTATPNGGAPQVITYTLDASANRQTVVGGPDAGTYALGDTGTASALTHQYKSTPLDPLGTRMHDAAGNVTHLHLNRRELYRVGALR